MKILAIGVKKHKELNKDLGRSVCSISSTLSKVRADAGNQLFRTLRLGL